MNDLAAFLRARLDEDEQLADAAVHAGLGFHIGPGGKAISENAHIGEHLANWNPARAHREADAKRARLARHQPRCLVCLCCRELWPCPDICDDLVVYSDHPDYNPYWAPQQ